MKALEEAAKLIKKHEGWRAHAYKCPAGYWTIGFGRNIDEKGPGITMAEGEYLLANDLTECDRTIRAALPWFNSLSIERQAALIDLCYNIGLTKLLRFGKTLKALAEKDYETASIELLDSKYASDVGKRAKTISSIILTGKIN